MYSSLSNIINRVFTVFSTSKDHRQGCRAMAGCILVDFDMIQVINRSPKYKNKYVHRRTSVSLKYLTPEELEQRRKLGLIRTSVADAEYLKLKREMELENEVDDNDENKTYDRNVLVTTLANRDTTSKKSRSRSASPNAAMGIAVGR